MCGSQPCNQGSSTAHDAACAVRNPPLLDMSFRKAYPNAVCAAAMQILGNNECFEPYTSNIYVRRVLSGEFTVVNQHLLMDLTRLGLWSPDLKNELVAANGSIQVSLFTQHDCPSALCCMCLNNVPTPGGLTYTLAQLCFGTCAALVAHPANHCG